MRNAEAVTFGGGGLNRRADLRGKPEVLADLLAGPGAGVLPVWRGKPLLDSETRAPVFLPVGHPVFSTAD